MSIHLHREMVTLNRAALKMCALVEQNVGDAARAFLERDSELANKVIDAEHTINLMELELTDNCLKTLALYQPVAGDLRFIFSLSKIASILERIGDLAENLARKGKSLSGLEAVAVPPALSTMTEQARAMLKDSIDSLIDKDATKARAVIKADHEVDDGKRQLRKAGETAIMQNPAHCRQWLIVLAASRNLERTADMAAKIAAEVIYRVEGKMIHHGIDCE